MKKKILKIFCENIPRLKIFRFILVVMNAGVKINYFEQPTPLEFGRGAVNLLRHASHNDKIPHISFVQGKTLVLR